MDYAALPVPAPASTILIGSLHGDIFLYLVYAWLI